MPRPANIERYRRLAPYVVLAVLATVLLVVLRIPVSRLDVPFAFVGDAIDKLVQVANVAQTGWLFHNERIGFPFGYDRLDFPRFDSLNYALLGPLAALIGPAAAVNVYYIAGFYLIAFAAHWSLRRLGFSSASSILCALLYAFLPYHILRGTGHLTNGAYFLLPLAFVVLTWLAQGRLDASRPTRRRLVFAIIVAALVTLQMPYNGVFFAYLVVVAAAIAVASGMGRRSAAIAAVLLATTGLAFVTEQMPVALHALDVGKAPFAAQRSPADAEIYALRLNQVLMPTTFDRRPDAAATKQEFDKAFDVPDVESRNQYIGVIGIAGFVALMWALCRALGARVEDVAEGESAARIAALFALASILLAISTGLGTLIAFWITAKVRTYNRVLPFLAFACFIGGAWMLDAAASRIRVAWLRHALFIVVAGLALFDVLLKPPDPHRAAVVARYDRTREYFEGVERRLGNDAALFQLPVSWYPEHPSINAMGDYEEFVPFLLTRTLRISYGVGHGRPGYQWNKYVEGLPAKDAVAAAYAKGFAAILIDGAAYERDAMNRMTRAFAEVLPSAPAVSADKRWWLFPLAGCCGDTVPRIEYGRAAGLFAYTIGNPPLDFAAGGGGLLYAAEGWGDPENWGTWSIGTHATLRMRLDPVPAGPLEVTLDTRVVVGPNVPQRDVAITANGHLVADATYTIATAAKTLQVEVPAGVIGADGVLELDFQTTPEASPRSAGLSEDGRKLGIGLATLAITTEGRAR